MRLPSAITGEHRDYVEPGGSLLLPLSCLLAIAVAIAVVDAMLGARLALIAVGVAAASLTTRLPRILAVTAVLCLVVAGVAMLDVPGPAPVSATTHAIMHARHHP
jgi:hypothetical protein